VPVIFSDGFCCVEENPLGPVQPHVIADPVLLRLSVFPAQTKVEFALAFTFAGTVLTETEADDVAVPQELVAVTVYVPPWLTWLILIDGFCVDEEYPLGPVHDQVVMTPFTEALRLSVFPTHNDAVPGVTIALEGVSITFMLTVEVALPQEFPAVTV